jgi:hypothetical protein
MKYVLAACLGNVCLVVGDTEWAGLSKMLGVNHDLST